MNDLYYKPSGKTNPISILYLLVAVCIAAPILSFIYSYAILYIPIIYLNFLCLAGIAIGLGFVANFVVGMGKVRNKMLALVFGLIIGIAGLYISWLVWLHYYANQSAFVEVSFMDLITQPRITWDFIWEINKQGTWGIGRSGGAVDGTFLTVIWVIELIAIIGFPVFFAYSKAGEPYLENEDDWAESTPIGPFEFIQDTGQLKQQLESKNYSGLLAIPPAENGGQGAHAIIQVYHGKHKGQSKEFYATVKNMIKKTDKDGKLTFDEKQIVNFIHISKDTGQQLFAKIATQPIVNTIEE